MTHSIRLIDAWALKNVELNCFGRRIFRAFFSCSKFEFETCAGCACIQNTITE